MTQTHARWNMANFWRHNVFFLWHPVMALILILVFSFYLRLTGRRHHNATGYSASFLQQTYFTLAFLMFYLAMGSPIRLAAEHYLFSAHMLQYALLTMVIPPLFLLGLPEALLARVWHHGTWSRLLAGVTNPVVAILLFNIVFAGFNYPPLLDVSLLSGWLYILESYVVLILAITMWWPILAPLPVKGFTPSDSWDQDHIELGMVSRIYQLMYIFFNFALMMLVWFYIIDTHVAFYSFYVHAPRLLSLTPLADQQLGVVILEAFMGLGFVVAFVASYSRYDDSHWYD
ncbi:MAG: hypothetical protein C7B44_01630 [Sulfobacillus thermosulfidooxidans]|nr:MAG: hypothetical protein C7B44_01630 [Sulfobacillus thermosulfidooxidans]